MKSLADACDVITDGTHYTPVDIGNGVPFLTVKDVGPRGLDFDGCARISEADFAAADAGKSAPKFGDVLFSKDGTVGKVHVVETDERFAVLSSLAILRPASSVDSRFLGHMLGTPDVLAQAVKRKSGSAIRRIILSDLKMVEIPLPPLPEQRRIAAILDHADALRVKRRLVLAHLNALTQSTFNDMFGASTSGRVPIGSFADVRTGSTPSRKDPDNFGGSIPWVKTTEVQGATILATSESVTEQGVKSARLKTFPIGSVIVAMYGQGKTRGQSAILGIPATTNQACAVIAPNDSFDPAFLQAQLSISYDRLRGEAEGGNQPNLSIGRIAGFEVLLPSIGLQREFTARVDRISAYRASVEKATISNDQLFASLQARAFRGELWTDAR